MRPVLHGDVVAVARALLPMLAGNRAAFVRRLIKGAVAADAFRRTTGKLHPLWGDGTLEAAASRFSQAPEPYLDDSEYCQCMLTVFEELMNWRLGRNVRE